MAQSPACLDKKLTEEVLSFCRHIAGPCDILAACTRGDYAPVLSLTKTVIQVLLIIHDFQPRLMNYVKVFGVNNVSVLAVDEWVFERDVERGFLGEALAGALTFPYAVLANEGYLHQQEVKLKKRLATELLQRLVLDFPELSYELRIRPEYFMYETMLTRSRLFPPTFYAMISLVRKGDAEEKLECVLHGFLEALNKLERDGVVCSSMGYFRISKHFADKSRSVTMRFVDFFKTGQRALFTSVLGIFPQILDAFSQNKELLSRIQKTLNEDSRASLGIQDPQNYVFVPTASGLVPLANRVNIEAFARKVLSTDRNARVKVENIGGILNDVYLVETSSEGRCAKAVVKRFRDWSNFKWFPLTLWSIGTRSFAVSGLSRLERECAISQLLDSNGFAVPRVLHMSPNERLVVMEYVEGEDLGKIVKRVAGSKSTVGTKKDLEVVERVGKTFAQVHALDVALGDTKPENIFVGKEGQIYLMDFEQASRKGDKVWDIAEFLYYSGHDISPFVEVGRLEQFAETFVRGYLHGGGDIGVVKSAGNPKYTKVFSVFTFPHIMFTLSNVCRKAARLKV